MCKALEDIYNDERFRMVWNRADDQELRRGRSLPQKEVAFQMQSLAILWMQSPSEVLRESVDGISQILTVVG